MTLPAYPRYKSSGVVWIGDVPEQWILIALRRISVRYAGGTPDRSNDSYWEDGTIPWINSGAVNQGLITEPSALITEDAYHNSSARWVPKGALVMALAGQGKTKGMVAQTGIATTCNQSMAAICPTQPTDARYLYWLLVSQYEHIRNMAGGEQRDGLNLEIIGSIPCLKIPTDEQQAIVAFLDRETGRIDRLVGGKLELIERLKEKRISLISKTITRGLPPVAARAAGLPGNPAIKPSGLAWLGEIPAHWEMKAIKWESPVKRGASPRPIDDEKFFDDEGEYAWVRISDVTAAGTYLERTEQRMSPLGSSLSVKLQPGALFLSIAGTVGKPCLTKIKCCIHDGFVYFPRWKGDAKFLFYIFASGEPYKGLGKMGTQLNLNTDTVGSIKIGLPPRPEQAAIVEFLDAETGRLDVLVGKVEEAVERLREYRSALITSAVSGKIDVRGAGA